MENSDIILGEIRVLRAEFREDVNRIYTKLNSVDIQTKLTNGRVTKLENLQENCPGQKAINILNDQKTEEKVKRNIVGSFKTIAYVAITLASLIVTGFQIKGYLKKSNDEDKIIVLEKKIIEMQKK